VASLGKQCYDLDQDVHEGCELHIYHGSHQFEQFLKQYRIIWRES
jgi:hypothetical protein